MITEAKLRSMVFPTTFSRGKGLYNRGNVRGLEVTEKNGKHYVSARVRGSTGKIYEVALTLDEEKERVVESYCDCPAFGVYDDLCKHCVAVLLEYIWQEQIHPEKKSLAVKQESLEEQLLRLGVRVGVDDLTKALTPAKEETKKLVSSPGLAEVLRPYRESDSFNPMTEIEGKVRLEPHVSLSGNKLQLSLKLGVSQLYVLKDIQGFVSRIQNQQNYYYGKKLEFVHRESAFAPESRALLALVMRLTPKKEMEKVGYYYYTQKNDRLEIPRSSIDELMQILEKETFYGSFLGIQEERHRITEELPLFDATLKKKQDGAVFTMRRYINFEGLDYIYFPRETTIRRTAKADFGKALSFFQYMQEGIKPECNISQQDMRIFSEEILPDLRKKIPVLIQRLDLTEYLPERPEFQFYLDMPQQDMITCKGYALYGERKYVLWKEQQENDGFLKRNRKEEKQVERKAAAFFKAYDRFSQEMLLDGEDQCYQFLIEEMEALKELGEVFVSDKMKSMKIRTVPRINVGLSLSGNLLNLTLDSELPMDQLAELLSRYDRKKKYYRLKSGEFLQYDRETMDSVSDILKSLQVSEKALAKGELEIPRFRALYLDERLKDQEGLSVEKERAYRSLIRNMKTVEDNDFEVPESLKKILRNYQKKGFFWLKTLAYNGFGGILADDMGLGKTLQIIAFLLSSMEEEGCRRSLIVAPASLVYNWQKEIQRFAPGLTVKVLAGTAKERQEILENAGERDILVTSYDLLKRDMEWYQGMAFYCQVIDEAQYIKNAGTKGARAVKSVSAEVKFALTGTPVENRMSELWSIFDYLMPGFFYSYERFKKVFETPIVKNQDEESLKNLQKMLQPFVLRRLKKEVLSDLPDKLEKNMFIPMEGEQKELYDAHVQRLKLMLENGSDSDFGDIRMQVLAELTRLRQLCCNPGLIYEDYRGGSAKEELCLELIRNAIAGGHKILLFSQFTSMLEILQRRLSEEEISFYTITGSTAKKQRVELMEAFNQDDTSVFCISLKAGGTGLNLTGADMVIHYDPWWNMAAENQATDRAHRIGQKNTVTVYKLVAEQTIEEKVIELQQKKKELADQVLGGEGMDSIQFNREELLNLL